MCAFFRALPVYMALAALLGAESRAGSTRIEVRPPGAAVSHLRQPLAKAPLLPPAGKIHRITVKFQDVLAARILAADTLSLAASALPDGLVEVVRAHGLHLVPVYENAVLMDDLCRRAARRSGRPQPDLNGTFYASNDTGADLVAAARALQALACVECVDLESLDAPPPPPGDIAPATPDLESLQTHRGANPGFDANYARSLGVLGAGVHFSDCEYGYDPSHEDLMDANLTNRSRAAIHPDVYVNNWDDHGTAALGISLAPHNSYGVSGLAPQVRADFYSEYTTLGYDRNAAIAAAVTASTEGDVILLEMQATGAGGDYGPAELVSSVWTLTHTATDSGVIVVAAAGNGNQDLDSASYASYRAWGDSGAILVGAGSASTNHSKLSFSTYGARVSVQAWGESVFTTGYGAYTSYGGDEHQSYTAWFNGTSSASACAAGVVCALQSYVIATLGTRLMPGEMRSLLRATGFPQGGSGGLIGPALSLRRAIEALPTAPLRVEPAALPADLLSGPGLPFASVPFRTYAVEASTNLAGWTALPGAFLATNKLTYAPLTNAAPGRPRQFFRVVEP